MEELFAYSHDGAEFNHDRSHRTCLWRIWDNSKPYVMFIGLNPSTANETEPDPTITRVVSFAKSWGFGGVFMMNLFTKVTPYPSELGRHTDHAENNERLKLIGSKCDKIIFAWGKFRVYGRDEEVKEMFPDACCLIKNKNGTPRHPLYIKGDTTPIKY